MFGFCISKTSMEAFWEGDVWHSLAVFGTRLALCPAGGNKEWGHCQTPSVSPPLRGSLRRAASREQPSPPPASC